MREKIMTMIDVALGRTMPQLVLKKANVVNVFTGEILKNDVAIHDGYIAALGEYRGAVEIDCEDKYVAPGFIDSHVHLESSMVTPGEFAKAVLPHGTTTVVADPHEIANVKGMEGIRYMLEASENLPLNVMVMLPSCVPSTPFENAGATLRTEDLMGLINHRKVLGLGEMMDVPSILSCDKDTIGKIVMTKNAGKTIDGHGPELKGQELNAYAMAGVRSDHECTTPQEVLDRLRLGLSVLLREGSAARNIAQLLPALKEVDNTNVMFCTDDRHPADILKDGHIDNNLRVAVAEGLDPVKAIQFATLHAARHYRIPNVGAVAPGYKADLVILKDLKDFEVLKTLKKGRIVAEEGKALFQYRVINDSKMRNSVRINPLKLEDLALPRDYKKLPVIGVRPNSIITDALHLDPEELEKWQEQDSDILKIAVIERHHATGNIGTALIRGYGLKEGAIASTIAHDSHNIVVVGKRDEDMLRAVEELAEVGGGITLVKDQEVIATIELPIAGLMSDLPLPVLNQQLEDFLELSYGLGVPQSIEPIMTLAFMALPVIPKLKITDLGLFDVESYGFLR